MKDKSDFKLSPKDYLFLVVCLIIFFVGVMFLANNGTLPNGNELIITSVLLIVAIPVVIYMIINIEV